MLTSKLGHEISGSLSFSEAMIHGGRPRIAQNVFDTLDTNNVAVELGARVCNQINHVKGVGITHQVANTCPKLNEDPW